jgi:hypothetical protein
MPEALARTLEYTGMATIGGLIALAVFRPSAAVPEGIPGVEIGCKLVALGLGFALFLWFRKTVPALLLAYGGYVLLTLGLRVIG